jgi:tetratricopeptide (TPR) repeat protein
MGNLAVIYESEGRFDKMIECGQQALRIGLSVASNLTHAGLHHGGVGAGHARLGRYGPALHHLRLRLQLAAATGDTVGLASSLYHIGRVKWEAGLAGAATTRRMLTASLRLSRSAGWSVGEAEGLGQLAQLDHAEGHIGAALEHVAQAIAVVDRIGHHRYGAWYRVHRSVFLLAAGDIAGAAASCEHALRLARPRFPYEWAQALSSRAAIHLAEGDPGSARRLLEQALTMFARMGVPERHDVERRLAELDGGPDQLRTPAGGGRMEA